MSSGSFPDSPIELWDRKACVLGVYYRDAGRQGAWLEIYGPDGRLYRQRVAKSQPLAWVLVPVTAVAETAAYLALFALSIVGGAYGT